MEELFENEWRGFKGTDWKNEIKMILSSAKIVLLDRGKKAENRVCPMNKYGTKCKNCNPCQILSGYGGAGTFSDGKLNFVPKLGKSDLYKYMSSDEADQLLVDTENIFNEFAFGTT